MIDNENHKENHFSPITSSLSYVADIHIQDMHMCTYVCTSLSSAMYSRVANIGSTLH